MTRAIATLWAGVALVGCSSPSWVDGGSLGSNPDVLLDVAEQNVIGTFVSAQVRVSSCKAVKQVQLLEHDTFLTDVPYTAPTTTKQLVAENFASRWRDGGLAFAAQLVLTAKVICDDDRTATSPGVNASFFPVNSRLSLGTPAVPDLFIAQGGLSDLDPNVDVQSSTATFIGCVNGETTKGLALTNTKGQRVTLNEGIPFACDGTTQISERSTLGTRWVLQPGLGAYVIDQNLVVGKQVSGALQRMGVASNGSAVFWANASNEQQLVKRDAVGSQDWQVTFAGIMNADPVLDVSGGAVWSAAWQFDTGARTGDVVVFKHNLTDGSLINGAPRVIHQTYDSSINSPIMPQVTLSADGAILYAPLLTVASDSTLQTSIQACSTAVELCTGTARKWTTLVKAEVQLVVPYSKGNLLAALGPKVAWFLNAQTGAGLNNGQKPVLPKDGLQILGGQPGPERDFYLLDGPVLGAGVAVFPTEVVAVDSPESGELYRFRFGTGTSAANGVYLGVDEAGQLWYRVGNDLVKPHPWLKQSGTRRSWYRIAKGQ